MEVNTYFNINFQGAQENLFQKKENLSVPNVSEEHLPFEKKKPIISENVLMDLKDVQNFLYMLIGAEVLIKDDDSFAGDSVNIRA